MISIQVGMPFKYYVMTFEPLEIETSDLASNKKSHPYSTNDARSNDTKVNDLVTLTLNCARSSLFFYFVATADRGHSISQTHVLFTLIFDSHQQ